MQVADAQREVRTVFVGGFWGQMVSAAIWLGSAALASWVSPKAGIIAAVVAGFFIFPAVQLLLKLSGGPTRLSKENALWGLGLQVALTLPVSMLLLVPVTQLRLPLFYPALMILLGAHYLPFVFMYGMRMFVGLFALLVGSGWVIAVKFPESFSLGGWVGGLILFVFAWMGRAVVRAEARGNS